MNISIAPSPFPSIPTKIAEPYCPGALVGIVLFGRLERSDTDPKEHPAIRIQATVGIGVIHEVEAGIVRHPPQTPRADHRSGHLWRDQRCSSDSEGEEPQTNCLSCTRLRPEKRQLATPVEMRTRGSLPSDESYMYGQYVACRTDLGTTIGISTKSIGLLIRRHPRSGDSGPANPTQYTRIKMRKLLPAVLIWCCSRLLLS